MGEIFIGSEAVASGAVTRYELQRWYRPIYPNVHVPRGSAPTLRDLTVGAWLWSRRNATIAGVAASALHGALWVDADVPVELIWNRPRPPNGIVTRNESLADDEITELAGLPVTTLTRTAFDLGRHLSRAKAVARMDALAWASSFSIEDVMLLAKRYQGARGVRRLREAMELVDFGAASPRETWLRLLFIDAGLPRPSTQIPVFDEYGRLVRVLDMGWEEFKVAAEYDGDQHQSSRPQYAKDVKGMRILARLGWHVVRVIREDHPREIIRHAWDAMVSRGWKP